MKIIITNQEFEMSEISKKFLNKYLERMKNFIKNNKIENEVYDDIEERVSEILSEVKEITDKVVIDTINEIGEPDEIFSELLEDISQNSNKTEKFSSFKNYFAPQNEPLSRNPEKGIFYGVCYGIADKYDIDPLWVRLGFIFGTFMGGMTIILYIVLIFLLPIQQSNIRSKINTKKIHEVADKITEGGKKLGNKISDQAHNFKNNIIKKDVIKNKGKKTVALKNENIIYIVPQSNIIVRFIKSILNLLKKALIFIFHSGRIFFAIMLIIAAVPILISLLFTSGLLFTDIVVDNQSYFEQIDLFLKIGIVGILFSLFFLIFGFFLKLLYGKILANALMINGFIGIIIFIFVGGIGFFNSFNNFLQVQSHTQKLVVENQENKLINIGSLFQDNLDNFGFLGANWVDKVQFIPYTGENIELEITSIINTKNKNTAELIFKELNPLLIHTGSTVSIKLNENTAFKKIVNFSFLRKNMKFYIPQDKEFNIGEISLNNIPYITNFDYKDQGYNYYYDFEYNCSNKILSYNQEIQKFECK